MKVTITNFQKRIPLNPKRIKKAVLKILSSENLKKSGEINICFVNDQKIKEFNLKYLGKNRPTDVLVFDMTAPKDIKNVFIDMVISADTAVSNARIFNTTALYELFLYVVHGMLHILGYDDKTTQQKKIMEIKAGNIMNRFPANYTKS